MRLLKIKEVAASLNTRPRMIQLLISGGQLRAMRLGKQFRVSPEDLERFIACRTTTAILPEDPTVPNQEAISEVPTSS